MEVGETIPTAAIPFAVFVLVYSLINLLLTVLLFYMQWKHSSRLSLISLAAIVIAISIVLSMIQQIHFTVAWKDIRDEIFETAKLSEDNSSFAAVTAYNEFDNVISLIRFYCYNVQSLLFLFWAIGLWHATRKASLNLISPKDKKFVLGSKIFAIVIPIPIVGSMQTDIIMKNVYTKLLWSNLLLIISTTTGSVFSVLILYTYVHVRRRTKKSNRPNPLPQVDLSFHVNRSGSYDSSMPTKPAQASSLQSMSCDRWLIARFLVCFALSNVFQVCVVIWYMLKFNTASNALEQGEPDYSLKSTLDYVAITLPGVSSGLTIFFIFGTTAQFRSEYKRWLQPCRRKCQGREGPIMVARLDSVQSSRDEAPPNPQDVERDASATESAGRTSPPSAWQIPPLDFQESWEKEDRPAAEQAGRQGA